MLWAFGVLRMRGPNRASYSFYKTRGTKSEKRKTKNVNEKNRAPDPKYWSAGALVSIEWQNSN